MLILKLFKELNKYHIMRIIIKWLFIKVQWLLIKVLKTSGSVKSIFKICDTTL